MISKAASRVEASKPNDDAKRRKRELERELERKGKTKRIKKVNRW